SITRTPALIKAGVRVIEQPLLPRLDQEMPALCWEFGGEVKLMADESLTTLGSAERLVESGAFNHYNLKVSKNGGILSTIRLYRYLQMQGMSAQLGAHFGETSILTAAAMWVAASAPGLRAIEGGLGSWLLEKDIGSESLRIDQNAQIKLDTLVSPGLGWGVRPKDLST
ncbi:MAG: enolase C-terminal domain-like protein, partial [Bacteroidota bacterium]